MSEYGERFDRLAQRWATLEREHDKQHPERGQCGGVGGCALMFAAVSLEDEMTAALVTWRKRQGS